MQKLRAFCYVFLLLVGSSMARAADELSTTLEGVWFTCEFTQSQTPPDDDCQTLDFLTVRQLTCECLAQKSLIAKAAKKVSVLRATVLKFQLAHARLARYLMVRTGLIFGIYSAPSVFIQRHLNILRR